LWIINFQFSTFNLQQSTKTVIHKKQKLPLKKVVALFETLDKSNDGSREFDVNFFCSHNNFAAIPDTDVIDDEYTGCSSQDRRRGKVKKRSVRKLALL